MVDEKLFREFLHLLGYYMCPRCDVVTHRWHPVHPELSSELDANSFHHKGELIDALTGKGNWSPADIIETTYAVFAKASNRRVAFEQDFINSLAPDRPPRPLTDPFFRGLRLLVEHRSEIFLRHGIERPRFANYTDGAIFPPAESRHEWDFVYDGDIFAVDTDKVPFTGCTHHHIRGGIDVIFPWSYLAGYIPLSVFQAQGGVLKKTAIREHYYGQSEIPLEKWIFIWDALRTKEVLAKSNGKFRQTPSGRNIADLYDNIVDLKKTQAPVIEFQTMRLFFLQLNLIEQKLELAQIAEKI